jgi:aspartyl-tRNA(Asn)/glutamyl-tRNA(Gln) amidotransferase subunit A
MFIRPELFRDLAAARGLPSREEDWESWQRAYETVKAALASLEGEEEFDREEPALVFLPGESTPVSSTPLASRPTAHPSTADVSHLSVAAAADLMRRRELSPVELVRAVVDRIAAVGASVNAFIAWHAEEVMQAARRAEEALLRGDPLGPLHGIPIAVKDLVFTADLPTTAGTRVLKDRLPRADATVIRRLREAGAILVGKLNLHELAYGVTSANPHFGPVRNPWQLNRIAGGSSGGSAAAVAASLCLASLGTDTGGSIRIPAACCGVVGLKPTYGRVSRHGVLPLGWSLDHVGPIARNVADAALLLRVLAGPDPHDPTASPLPVPDYTRVLDGDLQGVRIGVLREFFIEPGEIDPAVAGAVEEAARVLERGGARVEEVAVSLLRYAPAAQFFTLSTEASAQHGRLLRRHARELGVDVRRRLELGEFVTATQYVRAQQARRRLVRECAELFRRVDLLVTPTLPVTAPPIGAEMVTLGGRARQVQPTLTRCTSPWNLTGLPAISIPCGFGDEGLPMGLQIIGRPFDEGTVLRAASVYEQATSWHTRRPPFDA